MSLLTWNQWCLRVSNAWPLDWEASYREIWNSVSYMRKQNVGIYNINLYGSTPQPPFKFQPFNPLQISHDRTVWQLPPPFVPNQPIFMKFGVNSTQLWGNWLIAAVSSLGCCVYGPTHLPYGWGTRFRKVEGIVIFGQLMKVILSKLWINLPPPPRRLCPSHSVRCPIQLTGRIAASPLKKWAEMGI